MIGTVGGGLLGATLGSAAGPVGTFAGGAAGAAGGQWLANQAKKMCKLLKRKETSTKKAIKLLHKMYITHILS